MSIETFSRYALFTLMFAASLSILYARVMGWIQ